MICLSKTSIVNTAVVLALISIPVSADTVSGSYLSNNKFSQESLSAAKKIKERHSAQKIIESLSLTSAQKQQMEFIRQKYKPQIIASRESMRLAQQELSQMIGSSNSNDLVLSKHQELIELRENLEQLRFQSMLEMRTVLTPQQRSQLAKMLQVRLERFHNRFENNSESQDKF